MCKHSQKDVTTLEKRQHGLDARGNDPAATKRESSWAVKLVSAPTEEEKQLLLSHVQRLSTLDNPTAKKLDVAIKTLPRNCTGGQLTELLLDKDNGYKDLMDVVGGQIKNEDPKLYNKARDLSVFQDTTDSVTNQTSQKGKQLMPRVRRQSFSNAHGGITTTRDRSNSTSNLFSKDLQHTKGAVIGNQNTEIFQKFQESGAPFIGGASGTMQFTVLDLEKQKKFKDLTKAELRDREKLIALHSAVLVAGGHHSMSECLLAVKPYGYFATVPDPLIDYDASMKAFEEHLAGLGLSAGDKPLSRDKDNEGMNTDTVRFRERLAFLKSLYERYDDQLPDQEKQNINRCFRDGLTAIVTRKFISAEQKLDDAENLIKTQALLIAANARGENRIMTSNELVNRMGQAPKTGKKASLEYKAVRSALDDYNQSFKELQGRKLTHEMAALGFEELRAKLSNIAKGAKAYIAKHGTSTKKAGRRNTMQELIDRIAKETDLLTKVQKDATLDPLAGNLSIADAVEYARHNINVATHSKPGELTEERVDPNESQEHFGSGAVNSVSKLVYKATTTKPKDTRIFKPEPEQPKIPKFATDLGIDPNSPGLGKRNIASRNVSSTLGLGDLIPEADFTIHNGKVGLAMKMAPGKSLVKKVEVEIPNPEDLGALSMALGMRGQGRLDWQDFLPAGNTFHDGKFYKEEARGREVPFESPPADATIASTAQKSMMSLQWLDAFSGQVDRHPENYLVADDGSITGIDNDFSFGSNHNDVTKGGTDNYFGLPPLIDKALFDKIESLDWNVYSASLTGLLSNEEIAAAKNRFEAIKLEVKKLELNGMVVDNWETFRKDGKSVVEIMLDDATPNNYAKRDIKAQRNYRSKNQIVN